jgi:hypothetical protein
VIGRGEKVEINVPRGDWAGGTRVECGHVCTESVDVFHCPSYTPKAENIWKLKYASGPKSHPCNDTYTRQYESRADSSQMFWSHFSSFLLSIPFSFYKRGGHNESMIHKGT